MTCVSLAETDAKVLKKNIFKFRQCIFTISLLSPLETGGVFFEQTCIPIIQSCFVPSLIEIGPMILEKMIYKFHQFIFAISCLSLPGKGRDPSFKQTWISFNNAMLLCAKFETGSMVLEKRNFKFRQCNFAIYVTISSGKRAMLFIWTNINLYYLRVLFAKFDWNWFWRRRQKCENSKVYDEPTKSTTKTDKG